MTVTRRPTGWGAAAALATAVLAGGCSRDEAAPPAPATTAAPAPSPPPVFPLRGTAVDDAAVATRPALVVKIDNLDNARPQAGLNDADLVIEEKVEGPVSRLAVVFQARQPAEVGPVRSGRTTDVAIVASLDRPLYAFSGANAGFLGQLRAAPLVDVGYDVFPEAYERKKGRPAPYDLWSFPDRLRSRTPAGAGPPPIQFTYGTAKPAGPDARGATYDFGPAGTRVAFTWDAAAGGWTREQNGTAHVDADGKVLAPANVIIQLVDYVDTDARDVAGTPVPEARLVGQGGAWVLTRGVAVKADWSRPDAARPTEYRIPGGAPVALAPGQTWVALVPTSGVGVTVTRADGQPAT